MKKISKKKIEALGYGVVKQKAELDITGMTCAACATRIEKGLNKLSGISSANVNLALEKAMIEFNPSEVSIVDIIAKVEKLGYGAHQKADEQETVTIEKRPLNSNNENLFYRLFFLYRCFGRWLDIFPLHHFYMSQNF